MESSYFLSWLPMIMLAFLNAAFRELVLRKRFSELKAHQLSTFTLVILCGFYGAWVFRFLDIQRPGQALESGTYWAALTVIFEFSLGMVLRRSWKQMLEQYNLIDGHIWAVFLLFLLLLPYLLYVLM